MRGSIPLAIPVLASLDELLQSLDLARLTDESVSEELLCGWPPIGILHQAGGNEILELATEVGTLKPRCGSLRYQEQNLHGVFACVRRLAVDHLHCRDAERPDVGLEVVSGLLDDLRRHPEGRSDKGIALRLDVGELGGDSEIGQFDLSTRRQEHVGGLDIAVDLALSMQVLESQEELAADDGNVPFVEWAWLELGARQLRSPPALRRGVVLDPGKSRLQDIP